MIKECSDSICDNIRELWVDNFLLIEIKKKKKKKTEDNDSRNCSDCSEVDWSN